MIGPRFSCHVSAARKSWLVDTRCVYYYRVHRVDRLHGLLNFIFAPLIASEDDMAPRRFFMTHTQSNFYTVSQNWLAAYDDGPNTRPQTGE